MRKLLFFTAPWCTSCAALKPIIAKASSDGRNIETIDTEAQPELGAQYRVMGLPTLLVLDEHGQEVERQVGARPRPHVEAFLQQHLA